MTVVNMTVGGVTDDGATFAVKVTTGPNIRVAVADNVGMTSPVFTSSQAVDANKAAKVSITGLTANTRYWWQVEDNGTLDTDPTGQFVTHPVAAGTAADFMFIVSGDAGSQPVYPDTTGSVITAAAGDRISNHECFDTIREHDPLFFVHLGDIHYYDLGNDFWDIVGGGSLANYRRGYDDVLLQTRQHQLYREVPLVFTWDDHDYGPNDSDGTLATKANAKQAYRERMPSYPLPDTDAIYHSFRVGRVLFVVTDCRYYRSPNTDPDGPTKSMLGTAQMAWLDNLLQTDTSQALIFFSSSVWLGDGGDTWGSFATERDTIVDMLTTYGWIDKTLMICGDAHINAIKVSNPHGGFPVMVVGAIDAQDGSASSRYDRVYPGRDQYATIQITDPGGSEVVITTTFWRGRQIQDGFTFNTAGMTTVPAPGPSHVLAL